MNAETEKVLEIINSAVFDPAEKVNWIVELDKR